MVSRPGTAVWVGGGQNWLHCGPAKHHILGCTTCPGEEERLRGHGPEELGLRRRRSRRSESPGRCLPELRCPGAGQPGELERELSAKASEDAVPAELHRHATKWCHRRPGGHPPSGPLRGHQAGRRDGGPPGGGTSGRIWQPSGQRIRRIRRSGTQEEALRLHAGQELSHCHQTDQPAFVWHTECGRQRWVKLMKNKRFQGLWP